MALQLALSFERNDVRDCLSCQQQFGLLKRRFYCRCCGLTFCNECLKKKIEVRDFVTESGNGFMIRTCDTCYEEHMKQCVVAVTRAPDRAHRQSSSPAAPPNSTLAAKAKPSSSAEDGNSSAASSGTSSADEAPFDPENVPPPPPSASHSPTSSGSPSPVQRRKSATGSLRQQHRRRSSSQRANAAFQELADQTRHTEQLLQQRSKDFEWASVLALLESLDQVDVSTELLQATTLGKTVNKLKRSSDTAVATKAADLVGAWKAIVGESAPPLPPHAQIDEPAATEANGPTLIRERLSKAGAIRVSF